MKKLLAIILALIIAASMFVSCNGDTPDAQSSGDKNTSASGSEKGSESDSKAQESETPVETEGHGLPELNYNDAEVNIACWASIQPEFDVALEDCNGDPVVDAVYKRNLYTEQLLGVKLEFFEYYTDEGTPGIKAYAESVKNAAADPSTVIDIIATYSRSTAQCFVLGLTQPMDVYEVLDLSKDWWPKNIQDEFSMNGKLYFTSGDISTNLLNYMYGVFFNKTLTDQYGYGDLVQLVKDKEWTLDKMIELSTGVYEDRDDTAGKSDGDFFGMTFRYHKVDAVIQGCDFKLAVKSDEPDEVVKVSDDFFSETFANFISKMVEYTKSDDVHNEVPVGNGWADTAAQIFLAGRAMFSVNHMRFGFDLQDTEINYGILPMPLYTKDQQSFNTCVDNVYTLYSISNDTADGDRAAATIQALGYYGKTLTTPAVFEVTFKGKFSKDDGIMDMFDIIRENVGFDIGRLMTIHMQWIADIPTNNAIAKGAQWASVMGPLQQTGLERAVKKFNSTLMDLTSD